MSLRQDLLPNLETLGQRSPSLGVPAVVEESHAQLDEGNGPLGRRQLGPPGGGLLWHRRPAGGIVPLVRLGFVPGGVEVDEALSTDRRSLAIEDQHIGDRERSYGARSTVAAQKLHLNRVRR